VGGVDGDEKGGMMDDDQRSEYRKQLLGLEQKAQEAFDKAVLSLSGGALGVSFAFAKNFVRSDPMEAFSLLVFAWLSWAGSIGAALFSHYFSQLALRHAVEEVDAGRSPASVLDRITGILNAVAGVCFLIGVVLIACFAWRNT
jgi:hypothetical protein